MSLVLSVENRDISLHFLSRNMIRCAVPTPVHFTLIVMDLFIECGMCYSYRPFGVWELTTHHHS